MKLLILPLFLVCLCLAIIAIWKKGKWGRRIVLALGVGLVLLACLPVGNLLSLLMEPAYVIPVESSLWSFTPTVMNSGSGDWWLYGEDSHFYYHFIGSDDESYAVFPRSEVARCPGFNPHEVDTWCDALVKKVRPAR